MHFSFYGQGARQELPVIGSMPTHVEFLNWVVSSRIQFVDYENDKTPVSTPAFAPAVFDGNGRYQSNVVTVTALVVDIDKKPTASVAPALAAFHYKKLPYSAYTTASFNEKQINEGKISLRLVIPLRNPVPKAAWRDARQHLLTALGLSALVDSSTINADRLYFLPATRYVDQHCHKQWSSWLDQDPLDAENFINRGTFHAGESAPVNTLITSLDGDRKETSLEEKLNKLCAALNRKGDKSTHHTMRKLLDGTVYTSERDRDARLFAVAAVIARFYPKQAYSQSREIALKFKQSIEATNRLFDERSEAQTESDLNKVAEKLQRTAMQRLQEIEETKKLLDQDKRERRRQARLYLGDFLNTDEPYSQEEFASLVATIPQDDVSDASSQDMNRLYQQLNKRWIIQYGSAYYVLSKKGYLGPYPAQVASNALLRDLSLAESLGVSLFLAPRGEAKELEVSDKLKSVQELMEDYGSVARNAVVDLSAQHASFSERTQELVEAPCPIREELLSSAQLDQHVAEWLWNLCDENPQTYLSLSKWLAFLPRLQHPLVSLYLDGERGVGKTLLVVASSRIWSKTGPTMLETIASNFNDAVIRNPMIFADEYIDKEIHEQGTRYLRRLQQDSVGKIRTKYMPDRDRRGNTRLAIAANSANIIATDKFMTQNDIDAINERFLYIHCSPKARSYLEHMSKKMSPRDISDNDLLAKHALALYKEHLRERIITRFMITTSGDNALTAELSTNTGIRSNICHWLIQYLQNPVKFDNMNTGLILISDDKLLVNPEAFASYWKTYETNTFPPQTNVIATALQSLSVGQVNKTVIEGSKIRYFDFNVKFLCAWSARTGIFSEEEILLAMDKKTVVRRPVPQHNVLPFRRG